jgi:hypothetical protein
MLSPHREGEVDIFMIPLAYLGRATPVPDESPELACEFNQKAQFDRFRGRSVMDFCPIGRGTFPNRRDEPLKPAIPAKAF